MFAFAIKNKQSTAVSVCVILIVSLLTFTSTHSFAQTWQWTKSAGGSGSDKALDMVIDSAGNQYVCGYYNATSALNVSFGPTINGLGGGFGKEGFLGKLDKNGNWLWLKSAYGGWDERILGLCIDRVNKFVYVTGTTWTWNANENFTFGSCVNAYNNPGHLDEIFVGKFDLNGNCQWTIGAGGEADDHGFDMVTDKVGNIYLTGFISDKYAQGGVVANFGSINVPIPYADSLAYVAKINPAGVFQWVRTFGAIDGERDNRIAIDSLDNVYVTGGFWGTRNFGTTSLTSAGGTDIFVIKFDKLGNQLFVKKTGSAYDDRGNAITVDKFGSVYITGEFRDKVAFGLDTINNNGGANGRDIFVAKMRMNGNWVWAKKAGSNKGSERGNRIEANKKGNIFITGQFQGNASFGSSITLTSTDSLQAFVAAIDSLGKWRWAVGGGGAIEDRGNGICVDDSCNIYFSGYYEQTATFGPTSTTALGKKEVFVSKISTGCFTYSPPPTPPDPCTTPTAKIDVTKDSLCVGEKLQFRNSMSANAANTWSFGDGANSNESAPFKTYSSEGQYVVTLSAVLGDCVSLVNKTIYVYPKAKSDFAVEPEINACFPVQVHYQANSSNSNAYQWLIDQNSYAGITCSHNYIDTGLFQIKLISYQFAGCNDTLTKETKLIPNTAYLHTPNVFTPNGDNINDNFEIPLKKYTNFHLTIFDRWGNKVYETNQNVFWNGSKNNSGEKCTAGTYFYTLEFTDICEKHTKENGYLTLIRH